MKPPLIPFIPLILKGAVGGRSGGVLLLPMGPALTSLSLSDLTFLHEGSKTLLDGLVNVEKLVGAMPRGGTVGIRGSWGVHRNIPRVNGGGGCRVLGELTGLLCVPALHRREGEDHPQVPEPPAV